MFYAVSENRGLVTEKTMPLDTLEARPSLKDTRGWSDMLAHQEDPGRIQVVMIRQRVGF